MVDFGLLPLGSVERREVWVINEGETEVDVTSLEIDDGSFFTFEDDCGHVNPGEACPIVVTFRANEPGGPHSEGVCIDVVAAQVDPAGGSEGFYEPWVVGGRSRTRNTGAR